MLLLKKLIWRTGLQVLEVAPNAESNRMDSEMVKSPEREETRNLVGGRGKKSRTFLFAETPEKTF